MSTQVAPAEVAPRTPASPELDLLLACARVASADDAAGRVARLLQGPLRWPRLISLADGHGMLPLLAHHLRPHAALVPAREQQGLAQYALRNASSILMLTRELLELLRLFRDADILAVPYKGPVLALQLYGNLALRKAGDLDVLIRKADVPRARDLLLAHGYRHRRKLSPAKTQFRLARRYCEDFFGPRGTHLEVHWAFTNKDVTFEMTLEEMAPRLGAISLAQGEAPVFADEDLLLILAAHGAKHRWDRLEWICGVSELLRASSSLRWDALEERARELGSTRTLLLALLIAHDLLDAPVPERLLEQAKANRWIVRLAENVRARLEHERASPENVEEMLSQNLFQLPLQERPLDRFRFLVYRLTTPSSPDNWQTYSIGPWSIHLHTLTWPLRLGGKLLRRPLHYLTRRGTVG